MTRREAIETLTSMPAIARIVRADLTASTVIVVECQGRIPLSEVEAIRDRLRGVWPHNRIIVCDEGMRLRLIDEEIG